MDEKIIIKSKRESIALITVIILLIGVVIFSYVWNSYDKSRRILRFALRYIL